MIKTQVQLPDEMYARLKRLARRLEVPMADLLRRGADHILRVHAEGETAGAATWKLPDPVDLGETKAPVSDWREIANAP